MMALTASATIAASIAGSSSSAVMSSKTGSSSSSCDLTCSHPTRVELGEETLPPD